MNNTTNILLVAFSAFCAGAIITEANINQRSGWLTLARITIVIATAGAITTAIYFQ